MKSHAELIQSLERNLVMWLNFGWKYECIQIIK
jgi:hypothetical protein